MAEKYYSILTNRGKELETQSSATGKPVIIKDFVVGDGNGQSVKPDPAQTKLVREVYRSAISALQISPDQANQFIAQLVLPVDVGGFVVREVGLLTDAGELYSVANCAAIEKPENGVSVNLQYRLAVSETAAVELKVATGDGLFLRLDRNLGEIAENGPGAQKSAREAIGVVDATTLRKGLVQLSNATDSKSEGLAATPKAVKDAYDLAKGKYTAQNATTAQKGIVQLSSATDSDSELLAATPKAVKAANDNANGRVPTGRKINGHALTEDTSVTSQDIFNDQAIGLSTEDLDTLKTPGIYYQPLNANASAARHYPENNAGTLLVYKNAGVTQVYLVYNSSRAYTRSQYSTGAWTAWAKRYDSANKPSPADIGAVNKGGDSVNGVLKAGAEVQSTIANNFRIAYGDYGSFWRNDGSNLYLMLTNKGDAYGAYNALRPLRVSLETGALQSETPLTVGNTVYASKEITAGYSGAFAWVEQYKTKAPFFNSYSTTGASEYHPVIKQQATIASKNSWAFSFGSLVAGTELSWHLHMKGSGGSEVNFKWDTNGNFNAPGQVNPGSYANFDNRYYTKSQSDAGYMPRTGAYTKAESDGRFQPKGSYTPAGQAYTKAESDSRYNLKNTATKSANAMTHKDASTGVMEVVMSNITVGPNANVSVTFSTAFPSVCVGVVITYDGSGHGSGDDSSIACVSYSRTGCVLRANNAQGKFMLIAKGY
ncbi:MULTISPECIES: phage tail protein [unclassified Enterobacter cloacae complex]|uniref:phage tail-collar fiber domain-containing protein n=1 Tax=unclassified Enterobacter cloacae complex TaxID=2757714 RepID=UPI001D043A19|nr:MULTISPECIES: phage tail protein [unclassified Enterobacter cloacae complex]